MKLEVTARFIFAKNQSKVFIYTLFLFLVSIQLHSQEYTGTYENTPLSEALTDVSKRYNLKVAFDASKTSVVIISKQIEAKTKDELIGNLLFNSGFDYQLKHGSYLIVQKIRNSDSIISPECDIVGKVVDYESGEQLPFANIRISGSENNMPVSSNGSFYIGRFVSRYMRLSISHIGYITIDTILQCNKPKMNCVFSLTPNYQAIDKVVVKEPKVEMVDYRNDVDFSTSINVSKLIDLPVMAETDIFKALQLLPGISYSENSSELSIRGGSSDQNLILYDGQTLYNLNHYFGVFSSLNPNVIKDIQVYKGGYDSRFGERVSGIIDISGKSGNKLRPTVYGDINLLSTNIAIEIPITSKLTVISAARRSYSDIYATEFANKIFTQNTNAVPNIPQNGNNIITQTKPLFYFYDYNSKLSYNIGNNENLTLNFYGGNDHYDNKYKIVNRSLNATIQDINIWGNYGFSFAWQKQWNGAFYSDLQIGSSGYSNTYANETMISDTGKIKPRHDYLPLVSNTYNSYDKNQLWDISLSLKNTWDINRNNQLNFGFLCRENSIYYYKDADKQYVYDNTNQKSVIASVFVQDRIQLLPKFTVKPGIRASYYNGNYQCYFEPRFAY
jgi:ferric enterobactin receptor